MIKINEAMAGKNITRMDIARKMWPDSKESTQRVSIGKIVNGITKTYTLEQIKIICELTGVDANFLFGIKKK